MLGALVWWLGQGPLLPSCCCRKWLVDVRPGRGLIRLPGLSPFCVCVAIPVPTSALSACLLAACGQFPQSRACPLGTSAGSVGLSQDGKTRGASHAVMCQPLRLTCAWRLPCRREAWGVAASQASLSAAAVGLSWTPQLLQPAALQLLSHPTCPAPHPLIRWILRHCAHGCCPGQLLCLLFPWSAAHSPGRGALFTVVYPIMPALF